MIGPEQRERMEYELKHPEVGYWRWIKTIAEQALSEDLKRQVLAYGRLFLRDRQTGDLPDATIPNAFVELTNIYDGSRIAGKVQTADHLWGTRIRRTTAPFIPPEDVPQIDEPLG